MLKVLVVGAGGREHALVWKISQSPMVSRVYCAPGNGGISREATCVDIRADDIEGLADFAEKEAIDLTLVGPEAPLTMGLVDVFEKRGLKAFGATKKAAEIEGSKSFAKDLMRRYDIPTADYEVFCSPEEAERYVRKKGAPIVVKADGLAAGKGAIPCLTVDQAVSAIRSIMVDMVFGDAGRKVVVEEFLAGEEASFLAFTDGVKLIPFPSSQDHKPVFDNDKGPNTGGMGAYSPAPVITEKLHRQVMEDILAPTIRAMRSEGRPYKGVIYAGLMIDGDEAKVLEFNARFGDPEAQPLLMRMKSDLVPILLSIAEGDLSSCSVEWDQRPAVCVVMASGGYPGPYEKGKVIEGLDQVEGMEDVMVFHAGTARREGKIVTNGGRVLGVTALGKDIREAIERAYFAVEKIQWEGVHYRRDIGGKALDREGGR